MNFILNSSLPSLIRYGTIGIALFLIILLSSTLYISWQETCRIPIIIKSLNLQKDSLIEVFIPYRYVEYITKGQSANLESKNGKIWQVGKVQTIDSTKIYDKNHFSISLKINLINEKTQMNIEQISYARFNLSHHKLFNLLFNKFEWKKNWD